jgi:hypothetical protein
MLTSSGVKPPHSIAATKLHPLRIVLQAAGPDLLVGANANVIHADNVGHLFEPLDIFFETPKKVPDSDRPSGLSDRPRVIAADLPAHEWRRTHPLRASERGVRQQQGFGCDFDRLLHCVFGRMRYVADEPDPMTGLDHLGTEWGEPLVRNAPRLKVSNVVGRVVHELDMPDAALMSFLESLKLLLQKIEPFLITHNRGLSGVMRRLERKALGAGRAWRPSHPPNRAARDGIGRERRVPASGWQ